ncbi:MAG: TIGR00366 family protein [Bacteroidales bacterium]|nr:TIGR00366 family protein [Bacteroidales bacterium]
MLKKKKIPHTYVIVFYIIILAAVMTWVLPGGEYTKKTVERDGKEIQRMEFEYKDSKPQTWHVFSALFKGFERQSGIIVFILMIGGAFWIMNSSKAIDVGILSFLNFTRKLERNKFIRKLGVDNILIALIMLMFSIFGAVFGMSEETIAFIIIVVPLAINMGYDSITGVGMCFVAAGLGFAGAVLNPFTIGIAQGLADLPLFSGFEYRMFCWVIINIVGITYVLRWAHKVKKHPEKSYVYNEDEYWRKRGSSETEQIKYHTPKSAWITYFFILAALLVFCVFEPMTTMSIGNNQATLPMIPLGTAIYALFGVISLRRSAHFYVLTLLGVTIIFLIIGVMGYSWYIMEIATLFFAMGIFAGIAMNNNPDNITKLFLDGTKDIMGAAMIVGLAGGIIVILEDGQVIDTILYKLSQSMGNFGNVASVSIMYVIQTVINVVIPSGSAKAALTMPIMAPFSDLINIPRQATVMAFQFGDGFTNMITPTSGVLIGVLGVAKIPYEKWVKWIAPLMIILIILGFLLLIPTVTMDLSGFGLHEHLK